MAVQAAKLRWESKLGPRVREPTVLEERAAVLYDLIKEGKGAASARGVSRGAVISYTTAKPALEAAFPGVSMSHTTVDTALRAARERWEAEHVSRAHS